MHFSGIRSKAALAACGAASAALLAAAPASADSGGVAPPGSTPPPTTTTTPPPTTTTVPGAKARLLNGLAVAPASAPPAAKAVIAAANRISTRPYVWGGGHQAWASSGYDCSGAVSYALHGGGFLDSPLDSSGLKRWGDRGRGSWITVYTNAGHAYAVIAGLRWDTSGNSRGISGPRWHKNVRPATEGRYAVRHPDGY